MASKRVKKISKRLGEVGAAWATAATKHCSPNDSLEDQIHGRRTWHIHPDSSYPYQNHIIRFDTLDEVEEWLDEVESRSWNW